MLFFIGWHQPVNGQSGCKSFDRSMISFNRLKNRLSSFPVNDWILDSGAFTTVNKFGGYPPNSLAEYAKVIHRFSACGNLLAAVTQDYMCEKFVCDRTGLDIKTHQRFTIYRYDALRRIIPKSVYIMPVLQGYSPSDYVSHIEQYGSRLKASMWVGVGSVCKRNGSPAQVEAVLYAIRQARPDLKLHGFGVKRTSLLRPSIWEMLYSADSLANSYHERKNRTGKNNCPIAALSYAKKLKRPAQISIFTGIYNQK